MMLRDFAFGFRRLLKQPGFTLVAVLALALGIGANTAIFSLLDGVVLRPLPYKQPDRLVQLWATAPELGVDQTEISYLKVGDLARAWRPSPSAPAQPESPFAAVAGWAAETFDLTDRDSPASLSGLRVSPGFFDVWGVEPIRGRRFSAAEEAKGGPNAVLLSEELWRQRFGGDERAIGRSLPIDGQSFTIVGVLPARLSFPFRDVQVFVPHADEPNFLSQKAIDAGAGYLNAGARLSPGATLATGQTEADRLQRQYQDEKKGNIDARFGIRLIAMNDGLVGSARSALLLLLGAVLFVLLIACADVGNLLLAQGLSRRREMSIRVALGAKRGDILRQMLAEGIVLSLVGGTLGLLLAHWGLRLLVAANPADLPRIEEVGIDARVLVFTVVLALLTGILFSLAPALETLRTDIKAAFRDGDRGSTGGARRSRTQGLLVVAEVALSLTLLIGAGLLVRSFQRATAVDIGFNPQKLLVTQLSLPLAKYPKTPERKVFFENVLEKVRALPGVQSAALLDFMPIEGSLRTIFTIAGRPPLPPERQQLAYRGIVSPGFFQTLQAKLTAGQDFDPKGSADGPLTTVINEAMRREYFPSEDPIGKTLVLAGPSQAQIVGVVADVQQAGLEVKNRPGFFMSTSQARPTLPTAPFLQLLVRTTLPPKAVAKSLREAVRSLDPEQPVADLRTMEEVVAASVAGRRLTKNLLTGFTAAALLLCLLGIYGVVAHSVSLRSKEIGVRMALGAQRVQVLGVVIRQGLNWVLFGVGAGLLAALALGQWMKSQLFEVSATDPLYLTAGPAALILVGLLACYLPARRATRIEPAITLRRD